MKPKPSDDQQWPPEHKGQIKPIITYTQSGLKRFQPVCECHNHRCSAHQGRNCRALAEHHISSKAKGDVLLCAMCAFNAFNQMSREHGFTNPFPKPKEPPK
jgi:hypothetical protein